MVALATAHPAKFPDAIERAIRRAARIATAARRFDGTAGTVCSVFPDSVAAVEDYIRGHARPLREVAA